jgi:hypothetical protein
MLGSLTSYLSQKTLPTILPHSSQNPVINFKDHLTAVLSKIYLIKIIAIPESVHLMDDLSR